MGDKSGIEWTDATWNPVTGCTRVSAGCDHCYIDRSPPFRMNGRRFDKPGVGGTTGVLLHPERLDQPLRWRKPRKVFVNSLSDLFHDDVPDEYIARVWAVMALAQQHTFQVLTKRPGRMRSLLSSDAFRAEVKRLVLHCDREGGLTPGRCLCGHSVNSHNELAYCQNDSCLCGWEWRHPEVTPFYSEWPLRNVWLGVSVEDQKAADLRIPKLLDTPAAVRFLSCEPLLGPVDLESALSRHTLALRLDDCLACTQPYDFHDPGGYNIGPECVAPLAGVRPIDWVICGGESGPGARPMHPDWARGLRDQCADAGVAYLFKQWGEWAPTDQAPVSYGTKRSSMHTTPQGGTRTTLLTPDGEQKNTNDLTTFVVPAGWADMARVGKKRAGRLLDGRTHDDYPEVSA